MSYWVYCKIDINVGKPEPYTVQLAEPFNLTYNLSAMASAAAVSSGVPEESSGWHSLTAGKTCGELLPLFQAMHEQLQDVKYERFAPVNGWGSRDQLIEVMQTMIDWCESFPAARIQFN